MIETGQRFGIDCDPSETTSIDPVGLLTRWIPPPQSCPPLVMALSTNGLDGYPRVRHVLLTEIRDGSIHFHTDTRSAKVAEIESDPRAAVSVAWPELGKQFMVHGDVIRATREEEALAYANRSRYLQLLAWLNDAATAHRNAEERHRAWADFDAAHPVLTPPDTWIGFALTPWEITFWRGDPDGPSHRTCFTRTGDAWTAEVLPG